MDTNRAALARQLFTIATEVIENAHEAAVGGQSHRLTARKRQRSLQQLRTASRDIAMLADAIALLACARRDLE